MAVSVQLVSKSASEQLSMKYSDIPEPPDVIDPEPKRLSLHSFFQSNFANSPRRSSLDESTFDSRRQSTTIDPQRASTDFYPSLKQESFIISITPSQTEKAGPILQLRNSPGPSALIKKVTTGLTPGLSAPRPKSYEHLSLKYKLLFLCGVSNIDMVDNYVSIPR